MSLLEEYADQSVLFHNVFQALMARLEVITYQPKRILHLGETPWVNVDLLQKRYPEATIIECDYPLKKVGNLENKMSLALPPASAALPFKEESFDLVVANLVLPWSEHLSQSLLTLHRVLGKEGLFIFSALGPDTLKEIKDPALITPKLIDMHNLGDALMQTGFEGPVLDVDFFILKYRQIQKLWDELILTKMCESANPPPGEDFKTLSVTYELIFGHAWKGSAWSHQSREFAVPVEHIGRYR